MSFTLPKLTAQVRPCVYGQEEGAVKILGVYRDENKAPVITRSLEPYADCIRRRMDQGIFKANAGEVWVFGKDEPVVVVGLGDRAKADGDVLVDAMDKAVKAVKSWAKTIALYAIEWKPKACACLHLPRLFSQVALNALTDRITMKRQDKDDCAVETFLWMCDEVTPELETLLKEGAATAYAKKITRWLADLPANVATPTFLGEAALALAERHEGLKVQVFGLDEIRAMKMGSFLAVAQGSVQEPRFIVMKYEGATSDKAPVALVGKGITFDAGGISLKPAANMWDMTYDMCGAASVIGTMAGIAELGLAKNVLGVVAACENLPSGSAVKPGDVVTSMSGRTIEILNTDAEGRLVLADALTWTVQQKPELIVDMATLTGACCIALGAPYNGLFTNVEGLRKELIDAGMRARDEAWPMPVGPKYLKLMDSVVADIANMASKRDGGASSAAAFLETFAEDVPWAHFDIAATANVGGMKRYATGRPVGLLMEFLLAHA